jgi:hypothetical protein
MNEKLLLLWSKVVENKTILIKVGSAVVGAALGLTIATVIENSQNVDNHALTDMVLDNE